MQILRFQGIDFISTLKICTFSKFSKETELSLGNMWRVLENLEEKNLVFCLNKDEHHFKMYQLTDLGKKLTEKLKEIEEN